MSSLPKGWKQGQYGFIYYSLANGFVTASIGWDSTSLKGSDQSGYKATISNVTLKLGTRWASQAEAIVQVMALIKHKLVLATEEHNQNV